MWPASPGRRGRPVEARRHHGPTGVGHRLGRPHRRSHSDPGLGWQDLRTVGTCLELQAEGLRFSPAESATKFAWLLEQAGPEARDTAKLGTVDTWLAWQLSEGRPAHHRRQQRRA